MPDYSYLSNSFEEPEDEGWDWGDWAETGMDVGAGIGSGLINTVQGAYGLVDSLTFDVLPDWDAQVGGERTTSLGRGVEAVTEFAASFIPVVGWVGRGAKIGKSVSLAKGLSNTAIAGTKGAKKAALTAAQGTVAGVVGGQIAFREHEERLDYLVKQNPQLEQPVLELMAAREETPELLLRLRRSLTDAAWGAAGEVAFAGIRTLAAARRMSKTGKPGTLDDFDEPIGPELPGPGDDAFIGPIPTAHETPIPKLPKGASDAERAEHYLTASQVFTGDIQDATLQFAKVLTKDANPRNLSAAERNLQGVLLSGLNLEQIQGSHGIQALTRAVETLLQPHLKKAYKGIKKESVEEHTERVVADAAKTLGVTGRETPGMMATLKKGISDSLDPADQIAAISARTHVIGAMSEALGRRADELSELIAKGDTSAVTTGKFQQVLLMNLDLGQQARGLRSSFGRGMRMLQEQHASSRALSEITEITAKEMGIDPSSPMKLKQLQTLAKKFNNLKQGPGGVQSAMNAVVHQGGMFDIAHEVFLNNLLGKATTIAKQATSVGFALVRPAERMLAASISKAVAHATGNPATISAAETAMQESVRYYKELSQSLFTSMRESLGHASHAYKTGYSPLMPHSATSMNDSGLRRLTAPENLINSKNALVRNVGEAIHNNDLASTVYRLSEHLVTYPLRTMSAVDEVVGQTQARILARQHLRKEAHQRAASSGTTLGGQMTKNGWKVGTEDYNKAIDAYVENKLDEIIIDGALMSKEALVRSGRQRLPAAIKNDPLKSQMWVNDYVAERMPAFRKRKSLIDYIGKDVDTVKFTTPLKHGTPNYVANQLVEVLPGARWVAPFRRTPINLLTEAFRRLDVVGPSRYVYGKMRPEHLNKLKESNNAFLQDMLSGDPARKHEALGRLATGLGLFSTAGSLAFEGRITGNGPLDRNLRKIWEDAGHQQYSIRVGDSWVSYANIEPFNTLIGMAADMADLYKYAPPGEEFGSSATDVLSDVATHSVLALRQNFLDKSYLTGISDVFEAIQSDDPGKINRFFERFAANIVPNSMAGFDTMSDEAIQAPRGLMERIANRIPFMDDSPDVMRNVLGEPLQRQQALGSGLTDWANFSIPIAVMEVGDNKIAEELLSLGHGFSLPSSTRGGLDLLEFRNEKGQSAYDRMLQLSGEIKLNGKTLKQTLRKLIGSSQYRRLDPLGTPTVRSPRIDKVQTVLNSFRQRALKQVMKEIPEYREAEQTRVRDRRLSRLGIQIPN